MNNFNETIKEIKKIGMTAEEKSRMRAQISMFVAKHPVGTPIHSPWYTSKLLEGAVFLTLGLVIATSGLTFFATKANPGDSLYPLKTILIKPISIETASPAPIETFSTQESANKTSASVPQTPSSASDTINEQPVSNITSHTLSGTITVTNVCEATHKGTCPVYVFENTSASIRASNGTITSVTIDQSGNFEIPLPQGSYTVTLPPIGNIRTNTEKLVILSKDTSITFNFTNTIR